MKNLIKKLSENLNSKFYLDYSTFNKVWLKAGGKTKFFCLVYDQKELEIIINNIGDFPYEVIGAGSNFLVRDGGYEGIIFKLGKNFNQIILNESYVEVGSGILDINFSKFAYKNILKDFEFFSGIPGTIGGAIKMNAGCYGSETRDNLNKIKILNSKGKIEILNNDKIKLSYRNSNLDSRDIVISAYFNYNYGDSEEIKKKIQMIKKMRIKSQPLKEKTSGSTFKNPNNFYAAKLIEDSGCKELNVGDAYVSQKHANFLINIDKATATEIEELGKKIIDRVYNQFKIKLDWEIKIIGNQCNEK